MSEQCEDCEIASPTAGWLPFNGVDEPLILWSGDMTATADESGIHRSARGQVTLSWPRRASLAWTADLDPLTQDEAAPWVLSPASGGHGTEVTINFPASGSRLLLHPLGDGYGFLPGGSIGTTDAELRRVVTHWINLPSIFGNEGLHAHINSRRVTYSGRTALPIGPWTLVLDSRPDLDQVYREAKQRERSVMTHTMDVQRTDGGLFSGAEVKDLLACLHYAVSFALGHWACPAAPIGFDATGTPVWANWRPLFADPPDQGLGWWNEHRTEDLIEFIQRFYEHWSDPKQRAPLKSATAYAINAVEVGFVEQRLLSATAGLELLSWANEVHDGKQTMTQWKEKTDATGHLRKLLGDAQFDSTVRQDRLPGLAARVAAGDYQDGPQAVVRIRNQLTHPKNNEDLYRTQGFVAEASRLALRYLEHALLHRIDYRGHTCDRTHLRRFAGVSSAVPWARQRRLVQRPVVEP